MRRRWLIVGLLGLLLGSGCGHKAKTVAGPDQRVVTDMAGRQVVVPKKIHKVLAMSPMGTILVYTLDPSLLAGWNYKPDPEETAMLLEPYRDLPVLGSWLGKDSVGNLETIIKAHPDVLISMGDPLAQTSALRVQEQIHIPVYILDGTLDRLPETYGKAAELLGSEERAALLANECRKTLQEIKDKVGAIPPAKRRRYYYAEGLKGLETEPAGSAHSEALNFAGGINVAATEEQKGYGHSPVSIEQVLQWNPDIIVTGYDHSSSPGQFYRSVGSDPRWSHVDAVRRHEIFEAPQYPYSWIDRPPSVNRMIGIKWLANLFYPDVFRYDMRSETRSFYATFYQVQLSDTQLDQLLAAAARKPGKRN